MNTLPTLSAPRAQGQRLSTNSVRPIGTIVPNGGQPQGLRIRINLDNRHDVSKAVEPARKEPSVIEIKVGSSTLSFPYYKTKWIQKSTRKAYHSFTLAWHDGLKRKREKRASFKSLRARAEEIATSIVNGETAMLEFTHADKASYARAKQILQPTGKQLELAVAEYSESLQMLSGVSLVEAVRYYVAMHPRGAASRNIPEIVAELLKKSQAGMKWKGILKLMLERFSKHFTGPFQAYSTKDFDDWLDSLKEKRSSKKLGLRSRQNYRNAILSAVTFAQARGDLPKEWGAAKDTTDYEPAPVDVQLYTADELVRMLNKAETYPAGCKLVPFVAITAFAGVRHGEMNEEDKIRLLDWSDFDWESKTIYIGKGAAKTGRDRVVDMPDNLIAWLQPYVKNKGKICELKNTSNALSRLREKAGILGSKKNALRKSFISYRKALSQDIAAVADQAGNSPAVIRKNYLLSDTRMKKEAARWFAITPCRADVLPLFQWQKTA
jgi:integrase